MIKIIKGVYGHIVNGIVQPKSIKSASFSLSPEKEKELVLCGIAEYVPTDDVDSKEQVSQMNLNENEVSDNQIPEYDDSLKLVQLQELATKYGIDASHMRSKADVISALDQYFSEQTTNDGELPPSFDALGLVE